MAEADRSLAIFIDFENLARGIANPRERFDVARVLERLVEKGKIVAKKAYADWNRFSGATFALHEAAIELIEIPCRNQTGKNSADIRLCVDAMDLAYSKEHINTFVILSGDSDFSPLVSKLKELGKHVIGLGMQKSTSDLLRDNCDEFIYYEDLGLDATESPAIDSKLPEMKRKAFGLLLESLLALRRENKDVLWSSMIKDTMKRKKPSFNESYHGYRTFSELLEDAAQHGLLELDTDKRSRTYVVTRFGSEMHHEAGPAEAILAMPSGPLPGPAVATGPTPSVAVGGPAGAEAGPAGQKKGRRRRRGRGRGTEGNGNGHGPQIARPGGMVVVPMNPPVEIPPRAEAPPPHSSPPQPVIEEVFVSPAPPPAPAPVIEDDLEPEEELAPQPPGPPVVQPRRHAGPDHFAAGLDEPEPATPGAARREQADAEATKKPRPRAAKATTRQPKPQAAAKQTPAPKPAPKTRRAPAKPKEKPGAEGGEPR